MKPIRTRFCSAAWSMVSSVLWAAGSGWWLVRLVFPLFGFEVVVVSAALFWAAASLLWSAAGAVYCSTALMRCLLGGSWWTKWWWNVFVPVSFGKPDQRDIKSWENFVNADQFPRITIICKAIHILQGLQGRTFGDFMHRLDSRPWSPFHFEYFPVHVPTQPTSGHRLLLSETDPHAWKPNSLSFWKKTTAPTPYAVCVCLRMSTLFCCNKRFGRKRWMSSIMVASKVSQSKFCSSFFSGGLAMLHPIIFGGFTLCSLTNFS